MNKTRSEQVAHDVLCVAKYGSPGGTVYAEEVKRMARYLESAGLVERPVRTVPRVTIPPHITLSNSGLTKEQVLREFKISVPT